MTAADGRPTADQQQRRRDRSGRPAGGAPPRRPSARGRTAARRSRRRRGPARRAPRRCTATPAPTRNGQPGVLRALRRLAYSAGPAASSSTTRLMPLHQSTERCGSTRAAKSARAAISPSTQVKPSACAVDQRDQRRQAGEQVEGRPPAGEVEARDGQAQPGRAVREQRRDAEQQAGDAWPSRRRGRRYGGSSLARTPAATIAAPSIATTRLDAGGEPDRVRREHQHRQVPAGRRRRRRRPGRRTAPGVRSAPRRR